MNIAENWISCNSFLLRFTGAAPFTVNELPRLNHDQWYLVLSNHQSWSDIFVLQYVFNRRIPMLKFFIKQVLIYVPIIGIAWWALDFPIMKRFSREQIEKNPELRGKDLETTRRACENFKLTPVSILNFLEGTRFTTEKKHKRGSPFEHLLRPKVGGASLVLGELSEHLDAIIDVTIEYPGGTPGLLEFLAGEAGDVRVTVERLDVPEDISFGNYGTSEALDEEIQDWFNLRWHLKDERLRASTRPIDRQGIAGIPDP